MTEDGAWKKLKRFLRPLIDPRYRAFKRMVKLYKKERGSGTVTDFKGLTAASVVFDLGGYRGDWTAAVAAGCDGTFHIFEPHPVFASLIGQRFADQPKIHIHAFALGASSGTFMLSDDLDASSVAKDGEGGIVCRIVSLEAFFAEQPINRIDVLKMNIEGGEYDLLPALMDVGYATRIGTLLVQFHNFGADDAARRKVIRSRLSETHDCDWCYDFVWEQWSLREVTPPAAANPAE